VEKIKQMLTREEVELAEASGRATGAFNEADVVSRLYVSMQQRKMADDMIQANSDLERASGRNATALDWVTAALVVVGLLQAWLIWTVNK
jgi:hypothetical protein